MLNLKSILILAGFLVVVIGGGGMIGVATAPGEWYQGLNKPFFNPPNWIFAPVWTALYVLIAIAGWRIFMRDPRGPAMKLWVGQQALNWLWSPVFFTLHLLWPALVVILALLATIFTFIFVAKETDRLASWVFWPYAAWVSFASVLNLSVAVLN